MDIIDNVDNVDICDVEHKHKDSVSEVKAKIPDDNKISDLANFYKALGNTTRIKILYSLLVSELCVCDITEVLDMTTSAVSHQLKILKDLKLVKNRRDGKVIYYSLYDNHIEKLLMQTFEHITE